VALFDPEDAERLAGTDSAIYPMGQELIYSASVKKAKGLAIEWMYWFAGDGESRGPATRRLVQVLRGRR
jgi:hypothetical protein